MRTRYRTLVAFVLVIILASVGFAYAATNTVAGGKLSVEVINSSPNDFKPPECASMIIDRFDPGDPGSFGVLILGTSGNDNLDGAGTDDCIVGGGGNDRLQGKGGNDILVGGDGDDNLDGGKGTDICYGGDASSDTSVNDENKGGRCETEYGIP